MRFWLLAAVTTGSAFAVLSLLGSWAVALGGPIVARRLARYTPACRSSMLFRLRILPAIAATAGAVAVTLPIFLWFEERDTTEPVSRTLSVLALFGLFLLGRAGARAARAWWSTRRVAADWHRRGRRLEGIDAPVPAYAIEDPFPTVAVVGITRPALFIAERVLRECTADEVRAMVSHECAHIRAFDNVKRFAIRACPDLLGRSAAIDRAWRAAAEEAADAAVVALRPAFALELAQALIHVARLAPVAAPELASAFYLGGSIESRVRRLLDPRGDVEFHQPLGCLTMAALFGGLAFAIVLAAPSLHQLMEQVVRVVP